MDRRLFKVKFHTKERREDKHCTEDDRNFEGPGDSLIIAAVGAEQAIEALRKNQVGERTKFDLDEPAGKKGVCVVTDVVVTGVEDLGQIDLFH